MRRQLFIAALLLLCGGVLDAASLVDPALHFRQIRTRHFIVYFHQGEDTMARELATIAEDVWSRLSRPLGVAPPPLTHVILADQTELANGFATPLPYDTVFITAVWPAGSDFIGNTDNWLRLAFTHEFTHIIHLDRSEGWARLARGVFGRIPVAFPNLFLPSWQIEGLATYEESVATGEGRLHAGDFGAITRQAARDDRLEPLDRVTGPIVDWPDGYAPYAYGAGFHAYLADTYGASKFAQLADATARRVPFTASRVFKRVYGRSLGELWDDYERSLSTAAEHDDDQNDDSAVRITHEGFVAAGPRFASSSEIVYSVRTPHEFPALKALRLDDPGSNPRRLTTRYLGSTTAVTGDTIYFDQQEIRRNVGVYSDLYALDRRSGRVRALTSEARLLDPDASPDGRTLVCVQDAPGRRDLVIIDVAGLKTRATKVVAQDVSPALTTKVVAQDFSPALTTLISEPDTQFNAPRWSPDGRLIAVERHRTGALPEIVVVDPATREVRVIASRSGARIVTPAWRRDGLAIIAAVAVEDAAFNLFEFTIADGSVRQLTNTTGGATWPDVSPDGRTIVFVGYTPGGFDLFAEPYASAPEVQLKPDPTVSEVRLNQDAAGQPRADGATGGAQDLSPTRATGVAQDLGATRATSVAQDFGPTRATSVAQDLNPARATGGAQDFSPARAYSPWPTLAPTSWSPIVTGDSTQLRVGASLAGVDALQYHAYVVSASWLVSGPSNRVDAPSSAPDWQAAYSYNRWRVVPFVSASSQTSFFAGPATTAGTPSSATERQRQVEAGVLLPFAHVRTSHVLFGSFVRGLDEYFLPGRTIDRDRASVRAGWSVTTAHTYGYSISPEQGVSLGVTAEVVREALGAFADATTFTADARAYLPAFGQHHVFALRAAGGTSTGDPTMQRTFHLGGGPNLAPLDFGSEAISLLRGFALDTFAGSHVAVANVDYRLPLARPQRGVGTWPIFLQTLHAAVFADAGQAWTGVFRAGDLKTDAGAELSADVVAGYTLPLTAVFGAAWGHDGSGTIADHLTLYFRIGHAF